MRFEGWYLLLGALMLAVTFLDRYVRRLPITTTMVYLALGLVLGPFGFAVASLDPILAAPFLERVSELAVIISLFTAGLKLRVRLGDRQWKLPVRLAFVSMAVTVALIAAFGFFALGLPLGAAVLLGAVLSPTDPVLASDVQMEHPGDRDRLRFGLSGEAGLNDGTAFPFVMLGLGLMGLHEIGTLAWRWFVVDLSWAVIAGLGIGAISGHLVGKLLISFRARHEETVGRDEFISLGLIAFSYGAAILLKSYGFLAVFAAGLALRQVELRANDGGREHNGEKMRSVLQTNEQFERILEVALVLLIGIMLSRNYVDGASIGLAAVLFLVIRPLAVWIGAFGVEATRVQKSLLSWFGIRGIGSLYYLMYALEHGVPGDLGRQLISLVLCVMTISILVHGISVTPVMNFYERRKKAGK